MYNIHLLLEMAPKQNEDNTTSIHAGSYDKYTLSFVKLIIVLINLVYAVHVRRIL